MVSERNEGREGQGEEEERLAGRGGVLKYTSESSRQVSSDFPHPASL